jgi:hypothetical protein
LDMSPIRNATDSLDMSLKRSGKTSLDMSSTRSAKYSRFTLSRMKGVANQKTASFILAAMKSQNLF